MSRLPVCLMLLGACAPASDIVGASVEADPGWATPELDHPLPPPGLPLALDVGDVVEGGWITLEARDADPGERVNFLASGGPVGGGPCPARLGGQCLDLGSPVLLATATADANGVAIRDRPLPLTLAAGSTITFQAVAQRGAGGVDSVVSNPVERVVQAPPWRGAVTVDGSDADWTVDERFDNTSGVGSSGVTFDADNLYVLFQHPDVGASPLHWMHVYLSDGDGVGSWTGVPHNTQEPGLPFAADHLVRLKADGSYDSLESFDDQSQSWVGTSPWLGTAGSAVGVSVADHVVELRIPRSLLASDLVDVHLSWAYEGAGFESTYGGVPATSFVDGYDPDFGTSLTLDLASPDSPVAQNP